MKHKKKANTPLDPTSLRNLFGMPSEELLDPERSRAHFNRINDVVQAAKALHVSQIISKAVKGVQPIEKHHLPYIPDSQRQEARGKQTRLKQEHEEQKDQKRRKTNSQHQDQGQQQQSRLEKRSSPGHDPSEQRPYKKRVKVPPQQQQQ